MRDHSKNIFSKFGKKAIGPVVAVALLLVVSVSSVVMFQGWFQTFQSGMFADMEKANINSIEILYLDANNVFIKNSNSQNVSFSDIKISSQSCSVNGTIMPNQMNEISLNNCTSGMSIGPKTVVLITDVGVYTKTLMLKSVTFTSSPQTPSLGGFSGYAWGEQFGFISFNGTGYQVMMNNDELYGHAYSEYLGYISFNGTNYGVTNVDGVLTGYAYGENIGYINFNNSPTYQTTFNGTNLEGHAYSENFGYIHFNYPTFYNIIYS